MACLKIRNYSYDACDGNIGGIRKVYITDYSEAYIKRLQIVSDADTGNTAGAITGITTAATTTKWVEFKFRKNTASMTSTLNVSDNGFSNVTTELNLVFTKMENSKRAAINALVMGEAMAVVEDMNGQKWFLGEIAPITPSAGTGETGQQMSDSNQYTLTLLDTNSHFPRVFNASVTSKDGEDVPADGLEGDNE